MNGNRTSGSGLPRGLVLNQLGLSIDDNRVLLHNQKIGAAKEELQRFLFGG